MVFSSLTFMFVFLPIVLLLYYVMPKKLKNLFIFISGLVFYAWGEPIYVVVMIISTMIDYFAGLVMNHFEGRKIPRRICLIVSVVMNLSLLGVFKYSGFIAENINAIAGQNLINIKDMHFFGIEYLPMNMLPIGISFFTFQSMSYTIDLYLGNVKVQKNPISFAAFVTLFPQIVAGPIVRYDDVAAELDNRTVNIDCIYDGIVRFITGVGKKVLIANNIGMLWTTVKGMEIGQVSVLTAWLGIIAFTMQIYFDFSGYSDMAIGLGQMFGFTFPENFIYPYEAKNITDFWRRWHITLGAWFREYIYIPLGGNRKGLQRQFVNLFIVWLLTGLWHGASWNFALWGLYFFVLLFAEKVFLLKEMEHWPQFMRHIYGKFFIVVGWVLFAIEDFDNMGYYLQIMFGIKNSLINETAIYYLQTYGIFLLIMAVASTRIPIRLMNRLRRYLVREEPEFAVKKGKNVEFVFYSLYTFLILLVSLGMLISGSYNPFLYFRF